MEGTDMSTPVLTIVVPCYNEEAALPHTIDILSSLLSDLKRDKMIADKSKLLFVDDGSKDMTWEIIYKAGLRYDTIRGLKLARNAGHQNALLAGLFAAKTNSDCVISLDADLQDDILVVREFIKKYQEGYDIVYGVRRKRDTDTFFKRKTAQGFYKIMAKMGVDLVYNHADYRLMSKRALNELERFNEVNLFLRGIVPLIGFRSTSVYYDRKERLEGETKYPLKKMLAFAFNGITSFSVAPIRFVMFIGGAFFFVSLAFLCYFFILKFLGETTTGWTSLITSIWLIGGLQLMAIGLVGEYIGKVYKETKRRPKYIVDIDLFNLPFPQKRKEEDTGENYIQSINRLTETNG
jgi:glycosyltransferase involved in cell wall biosynthesis